MARSPKVFYHRPSAAPSSWVARLGRVYRSPVFSFLCLVFGFLGIAFGSMTVFRASKSVGGCRDFVPRFVSVAEQGGGGVGNLVDVGRQSERHKVMAFVGIQTGFGSAERRRSLRKTWVPSDRDGLRRLEESTGLALRFIIGRTSNSLKMTALRKEVEEYDDFLLLDIEEQYSNLPYKTLAFFKAAFRLFDCDFYVKADDDIYLRPDRLSLLLAKDRSHSQTYIGCMKKGPVFTNPKLKWYEPLSHLLGSEYFLHAYGPIYALSAEVVSKLVVLRNDSFRMFSNEDVTIGAWMLAMNANHENIKELCALECTSSSIAVWDIPKCSGLCNPEEKLIELHQKEICSNSPTIPRIDAGFISLIV